MQRSMRRGRQIMACIIAASGFSTLGAEEQSVLWDKSLNLRGALGYKDNLLLSPFQKEKSAFWQTSADFFLLRASESPGQFQLFISGEDRRYFSGDHVRKEQLLLGFVDLGRTFAGEWKTGTELNYYYLDQVVDASATETIFRSLPVKSHSLMATPYLSRNLPADTWAKLEFGVSRQFFNEPLDDYWEGGPELSFGKRYGHRSTADISYAFRQREYDTRRQVFNFFAVPDTSLSFQQHETELTVNHSWDEARHWRSRVRAGFELNEDNGSGFFDYHRWRVSKRFSYVADPWEVSVEGKWLQYDYQHQPALPSGETRERTEYLVSFRVQNQIARKVVWFAESEHEWSFSNSLLDEYRVNTVMTGVDWEF